MPLVAAMHSGRSLGAMPLTAMQATEQAERDREEVVQLLARCLASRRQLTKGSAADRANAAEK